MTRYPDKGVLQFFIADDDLYGMNFDDQCAQEKFRVVWHPDPDPTNAQTDFSFLPERKYFPVGDGSATLSVDNRFEEMMDELDGELEESDADYDIDDLWDRYDELYGGAGHKLLGYPGFVQQDPREGDEFELLFQLDSDGNNAVHVQWGDVGIGNFFIRPADLAKRDFSRVMYNWDCG